MKILKAMALLLVMPATLSLASVSSDNFTESTTSTAVETHDIDSLFATLGLETAPGAQLNRFDSFEEYQTFGTTASVRADSMREKPEARNEMFVIYGVDLNSEEFRKGDFIWGGDLAQSMHRDSDYDGISLPIMGAVITPRKSTVDLLAPDADCFIIDGLKATRDDYDRVHDYEIECVTIHGDTILVKRKFMPDEPNYETGKASHDEGNLMRLMFFGSSANGDDQLIKIIRNRGSQTPAK